MPVVMNMIIPKKVNPRNFAAFLTKVYAQYTGSLFARPTIRLSVRGTDSGIEIGQVDNDFSQIRSYGDKVKSLWIKHTRPYQPDVKIHKDDYPLISFEIRFLYAETKAEATESRQRLEDILQFAKLLMHHSGASYLYGGYEAFGDMEEAEDVELIYCKGNAYAKLLQRRVKRLYGVKLEESRIERLINETARIERNGNFTTVYFFDITPGGTFGTDNNLFAKAIKELAWNG